MSGNLRQREPRYENRALLDLAHLVEECTNCGRGHSGEGFGMDPAHQSGLEAGKAQSTKSSDHRHCAICGLCHRWHDSGKGMDPSGRFTDSKADKTEMWMRAHLKTFDIYWRRGWLLVRR